MFSSLLPSRPVSGDKSQAPLAGLQHASEKYDGSCRQGQEPERCQSAAWALHGNKVTRKRRKIGVSGLGPSHLFVKTAPIYGDRG
jgi:hypothetical protein